MLVLEGAARAGVAAGTTEAGATELTVVHAPGPGDDAIVAAARAAPAPVLVWTSDRGLRARLAGPGDIRTAGCGSLWNLLDAAPAC
ncbi:MAG: hypothetical protein IRZ08_20020 [Frankia sp.]|nr:hypothetical protein [Frankia sp.]